MPSPVARSARSSAQGSEGGAAAPSSAAALTAVAEAERQWAALPGTTLTIGVPEGELGQGQSGAQEGVDSDAPPSPLTPTEWPWVHVFLPQFGRRWLRVPSGAEGLSAERILTKVHWRTLCHIAREDMRLWHAQGERTRSARGARRRS